MRKLLSLLFLLSCLPAFGQRVESVATFSEMLTRGPASLGALRNSTGTRRAEVSSQGYYAAGDGGAARWRWTTDTSNTNAYGGRVAVTGGAWELIHNGIVDAGSFGAVGRPQETIPPYWSQESFSTAIGTGDMTLWAQFVTPTFTEFPQGLMRIKTQTSFNRLFGVTLDEDYIMIDLMSTAATNDASAGLSTSAGYWYAANPFTTPGVTNELAITRVGNTITVYTNGVAYAGSYVNQQAFAEEFCATTSNYLEVGQGWKPDLYDNELWWRERVIETRVWNSAVTSAWSATGGALATATQDETDLVDYSANIQAAIDWLWAEGGGTVRLPAGVVRIDSGLTMRPGVNISGIGAGQYSQDRNPTGAAGTGTSVVIPWYGMTDNVFSLISENGVTNGTPLLNSVTASDLTYVTEYAFPFEARDFIVHGSLAERGNVFYCDRVGNWTLRDLQIFAPQGSPVYAYGCNAFFIHGISGVGKSRGFYIASSADYTITDCLWGSVRAAVMFLNVANKGTITDSHIFNNVPQRAGFASVDDSTDVFTLPQHRLSTGDAIVFDANSGTLPSPLDSRAAYYVYRIDGDTFKVNTQRGQGAAAGALQGTGIDITTTGSGSWRVMNGNDANLLIRESDQVTVTANRLDQAFGDAVSMNNVDGSVFVANMVSETGWNSSVTNQSAFHLWNGSDTNSFSGNIIRKRNASSSKFNTGIYIESGSEGNVIDAQVVGAGIEFPVYLSDDANHVSPLMYKQKGGNFITANEVLQTSDSTGFLGVPSMGGVPSGTPTASNGTLPFAVDFSNSRTLYYFSDGWRYGALSDANKILTYIQDTSGTRAAQFTTTAANETLNLFGFGGTSGQGTSLNLYRALGTSGSPTQLTANYNIGEVNFSARNDSAAYNFNVATIAATTEEDQTTSAAGAGLFFYTTPATTTTQVQAFRLHNNGYPILYPFTDAPSTLVEGGFWYDNDKDQLELRTASESRPVVAVSVPSALAYSGGTNVTVTATSAAQYVHTLSASADIYLSWSGNNAGSSGVIRITPTATRSLSFGSNIKLIAAQTDPISLDSTEAWLLAWWQDGTTTFVNVAEYLAP